MKFFQFVVCVIVYHYYTAQLSLRNIYKYIEKDTHENHCLNKNIFATEASLTQCPMRNDLFYTFIFNRFPD